MLPKLAPGVIVRHAYFDEAGISQEPHTVEAGILMHIDKQYRSLQKYILDMAEDLVGPDRPSDFVFYAKDLWHGGGFFPRDKWDRSKRLEILGHLADVPDKWNFPVIAAICEYSEYPPEVPETSKTRRAASQLRHALAFASTYSQTNLFIKQHWPDEMAFVVVEDNAEHRQLLRDAARYISDPRIRQALKDDPDFHWEPVEHIVDEPLFAPKSGTSPLQIADVCAFLICRYLSGDPEVQPYFNKIAGQITTGSSAHYVRKKASVLASGAQPA